MDSGTGKDHTLSVCPVCNGGRTIDEKSSIFFCQFCAMFHSPEPCKGSDCEICKQIKAKKDADLRPL